MPSVFWIARTCLLHTLLELAADVDHGAESGHAHPGLSRGELERRFFDAVGPARREEAAEVLRIGRVSWRLRDDDNLLLSRVESQLLRAPSIWVWTGCVGRAACGASRDEIEKRSPRLSPRSETTRTYRWNSPQDTRRTSQPRSPAQETPRQLVGQPASPGLASGKVRRITVADDIKGFRAGDEQ